MSQKLNNYAFLTLAVSGLRPYVGIGVGFGVGIGYHAVRNTRPKAKAKAKAKAKVQFIDTVNKLLDGSSQSQHSRQTALCQSCTDRSCNR